MLLSIHEDGKYGLTSAIFRPSGEMGLFVLQNELYCVGWGIKLYSFTHSLDRLGFSVTCPVYSVW